MHPFISSATGQVEKDIDQFEGDTVVPTLELWPDNRINFSYKPLILWKCFSLHVFGVRVQEKRAGLGLNFADRQDNIHWFYYQSDINTLCLIKMHLLIFECFDFNNFEDFNQPFYLVSEDLLIRFWDRLLHKPYLTAGVLLVLIMVLILTDILQMVI